MAVRRAALRTALRTAGTATAATLALGAGSAYAWPQSQLLGSFRSARAGLRAPSTKDCLRHLHIRCYRPSQLRTAYDLNPLLRQGIDGRGTTIVILDSFGSPTISSDLRGFDRGFGLPAPPSLRIYRPVGKVPRFRRANQEMVGWAGETTIDVEWAHAFAPRARIVLLETPVDETWGIHGMPQMMGAARWALNHHIGDLISMSFGAGEQTFSHKATILGLRTAFAEATRRGVGLISGTGDTGATEPDHTLTDLFGFRETSWPATDPLVLAAGGTKLTLGQRGNRLAPDVVWQDGPINGAAGGGRSTVFSRPSYQDPFAPIVGSHRGVPDVSMSAATSAGEEVYVSFLSRRRPAWAVFGGTSIAAVELAGLVADADQLAGHPIADLPAKVDSLTSGIVDITRGNNSFGPFLDRHRHRHFVRGFSAGRGYDLASGLGTPDAAVFVPALARAG
jgi:subtilase family serine protease